ncbi:helix-turn-helix domain-containing protein [Streptomyces sp. NEAU-YJ-81]|nr:helix-turn-helix domain-containing protein [Streptomyces sp. NEAU-YJ-81]
MALATRSSASRWAASVAWRSVSSVRSLRTRAARLRMLMALLDILGCSMEDLIEPVAARASGRKTATAGRADSAPAGPAAGLGDFRPTRARIVPTEE